MKNEELPISFDHAHDVKPEISTSSAPDKKPFVKPDLAGPSDSSLSTVNQTLDKEDKKSIEIKPDIKKKPQRDEQISDLNQREDIKVESKGKVKVQAKDDDFMSVEDSNYEQTFDRYAPEGYTFVLAGSPYITRHCKEITLAEGLKVWEVLEWQRKKVRGVAIGPQRIGLHIPTRIYDHVQMMSADRNGKIMERTARSRDLLQSRARAMIAELYPRLPIDELEPVRNFVYGGFVAKSTGGFHKISPGLMWDMIDARVKHYIQSENNILPSETLQTHILAWQPPDGPLLNPYPPSESPPVSLPPIISLPTVSSLVHRRRASAGPSRKRKKKKSKARAKKSAPRPLTKLKREFTATLPDREMKAAAAAGVSKRKQMSLKVVNEETRSKEEQKPDVQFELKAEQDVKVTSEVEVKKEATNISLITPTERLLKKPRLNPAKSNPDEFDQSKASIEYKLDEKTTDIKPIIPSSSSESGKERRRSSRLSGHRPNTSIK